MYLYQSFQLNVVWLQTISLYATFQKALRDTLSPLNRPDALCDRRAFFAELKKKKILIVELYFDVGPLMFKVLSS